MINKKIATLLAVGALVAGALEAQAAQIKGSITFSGGATLDTDSAATASSVTSWVGPIAVISASDDFDTFTTPFVTTATFTAPYSFISGPHADLWTSGGFDFDLTSSSVFSQGTDAFGQGRVSIQGIGTISGNGFEATTGIWTLDISDPSANNGGTATWSFRAGTTALLPDGGATAILLGFGVLGMATLRRKLS